MKQLALILLALLLTACAGQYKSSADIETEAAHLQTQIGWQNASGQPPQITAVYGYDLIRQKGLDKKAKGLASLLLQARANPNKTILFVANKKAKLDFVILFNAMAGMDLTGVKFILAAREGDRKRFEPLIKASGIEFVFIDRLKGRN